MRANRILIDDHDKISSKAGINGVPETKMPPVSLSKFAFSALDNEANGVEELFPNEKTTNGAWGVNAVAPVQAGASGGQTVNRAGGVVPPNISMVADLMPSTRVNGNSTLFTVVLATAYRN